MDELTEALQKRGYDAESLHGDMNQRQRIGDAASDCGISLYLEEARAVIAKFLETWLGF